MDIARHYGFPHALHHLGTCLYFPWLWPHSLSCKSHKTLGFNLYWKKPVSWLHAQVLTCWHPEPRGPHCATVLQLQNNDITHILNLWMLCFWGIWRCKITSSKSVCTTWLIFKHVGKVSLIKNLPSKNVGFFFLFTYFDLLVLYSGGSKT